MFVCEVGRLKKHTEWKGRLADKLMDLANYTVGALVIAQFINRKTFDWTIAWLGLGFWIALYTISLTLSWRGGH